MQRHSSGRLFLNFPGHAEQVVPVEAPLDGLKASIGVGAKGIADEICSLTMKQNVMPG